MKNIYKKVLTLAMGLVFSVSAFAQANLHTIVVENNGPKIAYGEPGIDYSKYAKESSVKAAGVTITVSEVAATSATFHFDMNEETFVYFTLYATPGLVEYYVSTQGMTEYQVFAALAQQGYVSAYQTDTTSTVGGLTPGDTVTAYALALAEETDEVGVLSSCNAIAVAGEATGTAEVTLTVENITANGCDVSTTMNEHTAYYYFAYAPATAFEGASQDEVVNSITSQVSPYSEDIAGSIEFSTPGEAYTLFVLPYNAAAELGTYIARTVGGVSIFNANGVNFNIYPNPATSVLNVNGEDVERVELYNTLGQQIMSESVNGAAAQINVNDLAKGAYILKVYSNGKVGSQKVVVK